MTLLYVVIIFACIVAVRLAPKTDPVVSLDTQFGVTMVICVHAESLQQISTCLKSVCTGMSHSDQLIVVADHADQSLLSYLTTFESHNVILLRNTGPRGKKNAQRLGVSASANPYIVTVDADCQVSPFFWLSVRKAVSRRIAVTSDFMLLLPVHMTGCGNWLFASMVEMEFVCLQMVTAGTARLGFPTMANGAGMVFSRNLYLSHDSDSRYASGDDMFLLQEAIRRNCTVNYVVDDNLLVRTDGPDSLQAYIRQRVRWLGKAGGYSTIAVRVLALAVLLANLAWPIAILLGFPWLFVAKLLADAAIFISGRSFLHSGVNPLVAVPLELSYPIMILVVGFRSIFADKSRW